MNNYRGIIFAYKSYPELRELVNRRTAASLPIFGRYRLIDFSLSSLRNANIVNVGVVMQRDYQSLLDHVGSGKPWDMSRREDGLRLLPPFGLPNYHTGNYSGTIEALNSVISYIKECPEKYIVLMLGNLCANINLKEVCRMHERSDAEITAICANYVPDVLHHRYVVGDDGYVMEVLFDREGNGEGIPSLECYIINKDTLLRLMDRCRSLDLHRFHQDAISMFLREGGKMRTYIHRTYARIIKDVDGYYAANMDMLSSANRAALFPANRPVRTKNAEGVSTYYSEGSRSINSLVADNCIIEGDIENCILFPGVRVGKGAVLRNCIVMKDTHIGTDCRLDYVITDKKVTISSGLTLTGSPKLPVVVPKESDL
ncbi:MAG: glucose-1-phosphate adenylyltransferase subunit GlgD [Eubacteriales bacterium]|nr:glucose-1-phosphate adenylyltransferase subunit GlgD [Eubacteriales bacterium]